MLKYHPWTKDLAATGPGAVSVNHVVSARRRVRQSELAEPEFAGTTGTPIR